MQNIHGAVPLPEDQGFFVCSNHFGKKLVLGDLKVGNIAFVSLLRRSLDYHYTFAQTLFSYLLQSRNKQSLHYRFYISALAFSLLQIQHKPFFLLILIPTEASFPSCFNPKIGNLTYFCNFSFFSFYSDEDQFLIHDYQLLVIYVIKMQLQVFTNDFILVLYQSENIFLLFSCYSSFRKSSYKQVTYKIFDLTTQMFPFNILGIQ